MATADPLLCPDPLAFLTTKLGHLAFAALDSVPVAVPGCEVPIRELLPDAAVPAPLLMVGSDDLPDDEPDPPSPPPGHPAADPSWGEYDTWAGGDGWEPAGVDSGDGWPGVDSTRADVAELGDQVVGAEHRGGARMQVQPVADPSTGPRTWNAAEPARPGYPLRV